MTLCVTITELDKLNPCSDRSTPVCKLLRNLNADKTHCFTAADAREAGCTFNDIAWVASAIGRGNPDVDRRIRLFLNDCAIRVLHIFEARFPADMRPRRAIEATAAWGCGEIDAKAWATEAAWAAKAAWAAGAAWAAERDWQFDRLIAWLSPDEPELLAIPAKFPIVKAA